MRIRVYNLVALALVFFVAVFALRASADSTSSQEYQVKAAFLYNFLQFIDWPEEKITNNKHSITIGIIGDDPFKNAFNPIKDKKVKGMVVVIKRFESFENLKNSAKDNFETLKKCHLLFICNSERKNLNEIIDTVKHHSVLTVGEMKGFLEAGGIINWFVEEKKIRFNINATAAKQSKLEIRSKLLRLAKNVVGENTAKK